MNNNNTPLQENQDENKSQQPPFQWEVPVLYTEDWLKTLAGGDLFTTEDTAFHT